jgi:uncharacterized membrane protein
VTKPVRLVIDAAAFALVAVAVLAVALPVSSARPFAVFAAALLAPGAAVVTLLEVEDAATALALAVGVSLAVDVVAALALVWSGWWHPIVAGAAVAACAAAALLVDLVDLRRRVRPRGGVD